MGLDAAIYADDECDDRIAAVRIGNFDNVISLRKTIEEHYPEATVLMTKVLYSASHCGDSLTKEDIQCAKVELEEVRKRCGEDLYVKEFVAIFGDILDIALRHDRPLTFI